jgi:hypothetical protein
MTILKSLTSQYPFTKEKSCSSAARFHPARVSGLFPESGETVKDGALREAFEEAGAGIKIGPLLAIYHTPNKKVVLMVFRANVASPHLNPGPESLEAKYFEWKDIPWKELAFPMDHAALKQYRRTKHLDNFQPEIKTLEPTPNDPLSLIRKRSFKRPKI